MVLGLKRNMERIVLSNEEMALNTICAKHSAIFAKEQADNA